jgi:hypothetical protein
MLLSNTELPHTSDYNRPLRPKLYLQTEKMWLKSAQPEKIRALDSRPTNRSPSNIRGFAKLQTWISFFRKGLESNGSGLYARS